MRITTIYGYEYDSNIYIIQGEKNTIIDTGTGMHIRKIKNEISRVTPLDTIEQIILTHEHYDHIGGVNDIKKQSKGKAKIITHTYTASALEKGELIHAEIFGAETPLIKTDTTIKDGDEIKIGDEVFTVIHTPGHSPGSICLYSDQSRTLISGDTVFSHGGFGRFDLPGGDIDQLSRSIKNLTTLDVKNLYPGHGPIVLGDADKHIKETWLNIKSIIT